MSKTNGTPDLSTYIRARYPVIVLETFEERRAEQLVIETANAVGRKAFFWSVTRGLIDVKGEPQADSTQDPEAILQNILNVAAAKAKEGDGDVPQSDAASGIYLLYDYHHWLTSPVIQRRIRDLVSALPRRRGGATVVFCSPSFPIPEDLRHEITVLDIALPSAEKLRDVLARQAGAVNKALEKAGKPVVALTKDESESIVAGLRGLTTFEAENVLARSFTEKQRFDPLIVTKEKELVVKRSGVLSVQTKVEPMENVGGLDVLKAWLKQRKRAFSEEARAFGLGAPRGILLVGPPGTGKTLAAKATASTWGLPLLNFSISNILGSHVGQSESAFKQAWETAEAIAPCVLLIDEADKAFAGHDTSNDSGVMSHIVSELLSRMQERGDDDAMVFVLATANRFDVLPEPMLRKGRFDELWWVDLPNRVEREAIFKIHLRKRRRTLPDEFLRRLSNMTEGYIGSEIEQVVIGALHKAFDRGSDIMGRDLDDAIAETVPLAKTLGDRISDDRLKAKGKLRPASTPDTAERDDGERVVEVG